MDAKKLDFAVQVAEYARTLLKTTNVGIELESYYFANGFNGGEANEIQQENLVDGVAYLTPASLAAVITAIGLLKGAIDDGQRGNLRRASTKALVNGN